MLVHPDPKRDVQWQLEEICLCSRTGFNANQIQHTLDPREQLQELALPFDCNLIILTVQRTGLNQVLSRTQLALMMEEMRLNGSDSTSDLLDLHCIRCRHRNTSCSTRKRRLWSTTLRTRLHDQFLSKTQSEPVR